MVDGHTKGKQENTIKKRLLVLDIDNTLLHIPVYEPMLYLLSGTQLSEEDYYNNLPEGGLPLSEISPLKVYPRPHLHTFLAYALSMGYDLAICTTATHEYLHKALTLCGVAFDQFVAIITREQLDAQGNGGFKDIRSFSGLGYELNDIVAVDDRIEIYQQPEYVLRIPSFNVESENFQEDSELLLMIERLEYLGNQSLPLLRKAQVITSDREWRLLKLAEVAFDNKKYRDLPFTPQILTKKIYDLEKYPVVEDDDFEQGLFLVYKNYGLVGAVKMEGSTYIINNYCPDIWTEAPIEVRPVKRPNLATLIVTD